jgi:flagellar hook protein FlgE
MGFGTIHKGATGLLAFSRGLDVLSNNIANLNTPGFKRSDVLFRELFYQYQLTGDSGGGSSTAQLGNGVTTRGTVVSFSQGDLQQTGNSTDIAINGNGFFILRNEDAIFYTRGGQFQFDNDGFLVSPALDNARVAGIDANGNLVDINIADLRVNPGQPTTEIEFFNELATGSTTYVVPDVEVFDSLGASHDLEITFTNNGVFPPPPASANGRSWLVAVEDENGTPLTTVPANGEIRFQGNGSPLTGFNSVDFSFQPPGGAVATTITLFFGEPGAFTGATSSSPGTTSSLAVREQNGFAHGTVLEVSFSDDGTLELRYTNEQTADAGQLALAWFDQLQTLRQMGNGLFLAPEDIAPQIAAAGDSVMGDIVGGSVEISNVELTQEFTELIIVQRGYQASSQVVTVANEMIQQLLDAGKGR